MGRVSRDARLTFVLLWTIADDEGRLRGNSRMLASLLFPYDNDAPGKIDKWLSELEKENCVVRYKVDGDHYMEIRNWLSHQKIDHPTKSKIEPFAKSREVSRTLVVGSKDQRTGTKGPGEDQGKDQDQEERAADAADSNEGQSLCDWLAWWNSLHSESLVPAGVNEAEPSQGVARAWGRVERKNVTGGQLRKLLANRDAIEREIRASSFCRKSWFRLEKLFGGTNRDGELVLQKLLDGGYRDTGNDRADPRGNIQTLNTYLQGLDDGDDHEAEI
jgi:hypothetical protein